ncbi:MAG: hypothetical protein ACPG5Q_13830, partial [Paracoccaceae bacterium]
KQTRPSQPAFITNELCPAGGVVQAGKVLCLRAGRRILVVHSHPERFPLKFFFECGSACAAL